ncbi:MAG: mechanosensitive ion channel [Candidatus Krumholzibacteriia bacterium]|nr:mechanosensitive ion channel [bacterium]MCB9514063.1 mechanosensitive ion channel [Candidatus Latescibacterota bacterium]MCB9515711.1 mechanosensitive ion channel [Candidatus Latescibacterota bacterium]
MEPILQRLSDAITGALGISEGLLHKLVFSLLVWLGYLALRMLIGALLHRRVADVTRRYVVGKTVQYLLGFSLAMALLVVWFGNVTGWAAYLGIVSAGLAIALQDPVTNLAGWVFLSVRKPFVVGDRIQIGDHRGDVIDMRLFQFSLMEVGNWVDADQSTGRIIHIPNGWVFKQSTANYTKGFNFIWNELPVTVTFESDWKKAKGILAEIAERQSLLASEAAQAQVRRAARDYMIHFQHLTPIVWTRVVDVGVTLTVRYITEPRRRRGGEEKLWEEILTVFAQHDDIDFAYPTVRYYDNVSEGKAGARAAAHGGEA